MKKRKFLTPLAVSVAALIAAGNAEAKGVDVKGAAFSNQTEVSSKQVETPRFLDLDKDFVLKRSQETTQFAQHRSHYSHRSHASHSSHTSHYSSYW